MAENQSTRLCSVEGCGRKLRARGYCVSHYNRVRSYGSIDRPCKQCGKGIPLDKGHVKLCDECNQCSVEGCTGGDISKGLCQEHYMAVRRYGSFEKPCYYCGRKIPVGGPIACEKCKTCKGPGCDRLVHSHGLCPAHLSRLKSTGSVNRPCLKCGEEIPISEGAARRYCNDECKPKCPIEGCEMPVGLHGYCTRHGQVFGKFGKIISLDYTCVRCGKFVARSNSEYGHSTTKKLCSGCESRSTRNFRAYRKKVIDGGSAYCGLCDLPIDLTLKGSNPGALSIDHIVPYSMGGSDRDANLQPTHVRCNSSKQNRWLKPPKNDELVIF